MKRYISRRDFLKLLGLSTGAAYLASCAPRILTTETPVPTTEAFSTLTLSQIPFRICFNVEYRKNPDKDFETAGLFDPAKGVLGTLLNNQEYQQFSFRVADIKAQIGEGVTRLESLGIIPEGATFDFENWFSVGGWARNVNTLWLSNLSIGNIPLLTAAEQRKFIFRTFHNNEDYSSPIYPFATYAANGVRVKDEGVDGSPAVKFSISGGAGASWMVFNEPIDLSTLSDDDMLQVSLKAGKTQGEKWLPPPMLSAPAVPPPTYEIGTGKPFENISDFPWESLTAGDVVYIHWRETPYQEKIGIVAQGTAEKPIIIYGVPNAEGQLPQIDGHHAFTRATMPLGNQRSSLICLGSFEKPAQYVTIQNHEVFNASKFKMYHPSGETELEKYAEGASGIYILRGENITIRNCTIHDCGNGLFVSSFSNLDHYSNKPLFDSEVQFVSRDILVESNYFYENGVPGRMFEHHSYCTAINTVYQFNHYGKLANGSTGYGLKDRGAGTVIRYNWIEDGRRQISLDDGEDCPLIPFDPHYHDSYIYGNILIEPDGGFLLWGDDEIIHFGGDNENVPDRSGTLYFSNNTVITYRTIETYNQYNTVKWAQGREPRTCLFYLPIHDQIVQATNNIFCRAGDAALSIINDSGLDHPAGTVKLSHNWLSTGWLNKMEGDGLVEEEGVNLTGDQPGFADLVNQDLELAQDSVCLGSGIPTEVPLEFIYELHQKGALRSTEAPVNIGAY